MQNYDEAQELLAAYIAADKERVVNNVSIRDQWGIHNKINELGYYIDNDNKLEKRQGYWGVPCKRWNGDVIEVCEW